MQPAVSWHTRVAFAPQRAESDRLRRAPGTEQQTIGVEHDPVVAHACNAVGGRRPCQGARSTAQASRGERQPPLGCGYNNNNNNSNNNEGNLLLSIQSNRVGQVASQVVGQKGSQALR